MSLQRGRTRLILTGVLTGLLLILSSPAAQPASAGGVPVRGSAYMGMGVLAHDGRAAGADDPSNINRASQIEGVDVSGYQGNVAWSTLWSSGVKWAYAKATEGTSYTNPYFTQQYNGPYNVGMIRGAYHFATPDTSGGVTQADHFLAHGGGWSKDGKTLPGVLDIEWNPYGASCYGKSKSDMVAWIRDFLNRYKSRTGRDAIIYTATSWWTQCTGNYGGFAASTPLWIARYATEPGALPTGWSYHTMWQYTSTGKTVGDHDCFNGSLDRLKALATG
ncbi:lysozyme [Streptomyces fodineus]|uniref:lysozyme n=1 Tax=Streptomyces fodineus TaxID=1904616 RepID=A0A1D7YPZ2_9ACTN|nr:lysozyme [Streptomyces fodineus]